LAEILLKANSSACAPASFDALSNRVGIDPRNLSPFHWHHAPTIVCDSPVSPSIPTLFLLSCPSAVFRGIARVVVFAFKRHAGWTIPHVFEKSLKRIPPLWADRNPSAPIRSVCGVFRVFTPLDHSCPNFVNAGSGIAVTRVYPGHAFSVEASTRLCPPTFKLSGCNMSRIAAFTGAKPFCGIFSRTLPIVDDCKSSKGLA
jgi:hypothetical protein